MFQNWLEMLQFVVFSALVASSFSAVPGRLQNIEGKIEDNMVVNRLRRSPIAFGARAVKTLLEGAEFLYSNGLDSIFAKPGGLQRAMKDFDFANQGKRAKNLLPPEQNGLLKMGKVGNNKLILRQDGVTGSVVLQITKLPPSGERMALAVHKIIVYSD